MTKVKYLVEWENDFQLTYNKIYDATVCKNGWLTLKDDDGKVLDGLLMIVGETRWFEYATEEYREMVLNEILKK